MDILKCIHFIILLDNFCYNFSNFSADIIQIELLQKSVCAIYCALHCCHGIQQHNIYHPNIVITD